MTAMVVGCDESPALNEDGDAGIASLSPAMTTIVQDLGAGDRLVGRTPWCRGVAHLPVVGALDGVDAEVLVQLRPAIVVHQPPAAGTDPVLLALQARMGFTLVGGGLDGIDDVIAAIDALQATGVGDLEQAAGRRAVLSEMRAAAEVVRDDAVKVLLLFSVDPFSAAGVGTYLDEVVRAAGGRNAMVRRGWMELSVEEVVGLAPDVVVMVTGDSGIAVEIAEGLVALPWSETPRIEVLQGDDALEPSTRMPAVVERMRGLLWETVP